LFNPISPQNYGKIEKDGADAVAFKAYLGDFTDAQIVYNVENEFKQNNIAGRFRSKIGAYDIALMGGTMLNEIILGGDVAGDLSVAGVRGEILVRTKQKKVSESEITWIFGIDNQFTGELYGMAEYYHNGEGTRNREQYNFERVAKGEMINVATDYVMVVSNYRFSMVTIAAIALNHNLNDGSGFVSPTVVYSIAQDAELTLGCQLTYGAKGTEYWYYPPSVYLKCQVYF
jgi:hypothetical protein